jgi:hypothetical protein
MTTSVILAVEDAVSEVVSRRILEHFGIRVAQSIGHTGYGYLKKKAGALNKTALGFPIFMLTDLDSPNRCPVEILESWIGAPRNPDFLLRVAVMEVESWVLADRDAFAHFAGIAVAHVPNDPDAINDPKRFLVNLVRKSRNAGLRKDIVPATGSTTAVGPAYNQRLSSFIESSWSPALAAAISTSLQRTMNALDLFVASRRLTPS